MLISYTGSLFQHLLIEVYYEVANTAQVTNSVYAFEQTKKHEHSQEIALADLELLKEKQTQEKQKQQQRNHQQLKKQIKILNEISSFSDCFTFKPLKNFRSIFLYTSVSQQISLPPPQLFA
ncbi:MAG: hypothetical protein AAFO82_04340 [Bacteroidota bacterium]